MIKDLKDLIEQVKSREKRKIVVAAAEDLDVLEVVEEVKKLELAEFILVGDAEKIEKIAADNNKKLLCEIIHEPDHKKAAEKAVELVVKGEAGAIMKGLLHTGTFLKAVLNKEKGLNRGKLVSQISVFDKESGEGLQLLTDCAMAIQPSLDEKKQIIENAVALALKLGYDKPKVALISALEVVNPAINDTLEAAILSKMGDRGQIKNAIIDGPLALDNAISIESAKHKGIEGVVAGQADILVAPNLQVGNVLTKALTYYAHKDVAAAVIGAGAPVIMTSRADSVKNKVFSVALASYIS
ncbi:bifunctional enoyl-CoA hydratase/phosphate acetyltransferase [Clostridiaceae bacterium UIB06]|uniref:Bifunctional enoyl-CoA hydratase/phosphate acetyltransferase n=1 Tax=Clostridium thailandense TaxID=2794346 RepID=A0A949TJY1_9CLOT|nr:bifunctional enoyl-CoA hydratase/phosphate acetyltransferase [Clostridium thailandense]MBV7273675.1 bifunctional enoyl-CoA hydratase/phosphate acetyltransferase [Clostridium thailandense]MCH5137067.1 bifunctional enoyl-CoA hydratase/phosphate acetyltransferase [Clostridiaceae bacterium UIB06]